MGFNRPSKIQAAALPIVLGDTAGGAANLVAQSQSGTGKTAAFTLCMLQRVDVGLAVPQALCLVPTRELATQHAETCRAMGKHVEGLRLRLAVPDGKKKKGGKKPKNSVTEHIVVGTPGTVWDLIQRGTMGVDRMRVLVLDEADEMVGKQGFSDMSKKIKKKIMDKVADLQIVLFSATFEGDEVVDFADAFVGKGAKRIRLKRSERAVKGIAQFYMECASADARLGVLGSIYGALTLAQSIIFVETKKTADALHAAMMQAGHTVSLLHGGLEPKMRDDVSEKFRVGTNKVLITTNVLSRGYDVQQVSLVVNYDLPLDSKRQPDAETFLHRVGRTGRFGRKGVAVSFVYDDATKRNLEVIRKQLDVEIPQIGIPGGETDNQDDESQLELALEEAGAGK